jgi:quercetin dioxygenase-like cupin family protein
MTDLRGVVQPGPGTGDLLIRLNRHDSAGALGVVEMEMPAGATGPPLHVHPTHGEGFYVITGLLSFQLGDEIVAGGPGTWVYAPKDTPHTLANHSDQDGRLLCMFAPAGFERRFERVVAERTGASVPDPPSEAEAATRIVGPPMPRQS